MDIKSDINSDVWAKFLFSNNLALDNLDVAKNIVTDLLISIKPNLHKIDLLLSEYRANAAMVIANNNPNPHEYLALLPEKESVNTLQEIDNAIQKYMDLIKHALTESKQSLKVNLPDVQPFEDAYTSYASLDEQPEPALNPDSFNTLL